MVLLAIGLEIALHFSNKNQGKLLTHIRNARFELKCPSTYAGWRTRGAAITESGILHFVYVRVPHSHLSSWLILK